MQATPRVSVLMTCYNRARYLATAIESILAQTFTDFELLIVDDASTDGSLDIAHQYAALDSRIRVAVNDRNIGDYPNRNRAAALATGEYLRYADSDDIQYPHCLAVLVALMDRAPTAGVALGGSRAWPGGPVPMLLSPRQAYQREFIGHGLFNLGPGAALFRREAFNAAGGFAEDPLLGSASDYLFWLHFVTRWPVLLVPADLFWYRVHAGQELNDARHAERNARLGKYVWAALHRPDVPLEGAELEVARRNHASVVARRVLRDIRAGRPTLALIRIRESGMSFGEWLRYVRRPSRRADAGTTHDERGDPAVPDWVRARVPPRDHA